MTKPTRPLAHALLVMATLLGCSSDDPLGPGEDAEWEVVFSDDFDRSNGLPGSNWDVQVFSTTGVSATVTVTDNRLAVSGGEYYAMRYADSVTGDTIRVTVVCATMAGPYTGVPDGTGGTTAGCGVVAKSRDVGNNWQFQEAYGAFLNPNIDAVSISRWDSGGQTVLASGSYAVGALESHRITLTVEGNRVTMRVEALAGGASTTLTAVDPQPLTVGGIVSMNGAQSVNDVIFFDDFVVERRE